MGFALVILLVLSVLSIDNYRNGLIQEDGSRVVNMRYYDGYVRNAVVYELSHSIPPEMPFAAGLPLSYHYGMDLFIVIFHRTFDLDLFDLIHRFTLTFFFLLFLSSVYLLARRLSGSDQVALLAAFLAVFSSGGLAYIATYLLGIDQWGNLFYSFYFFHFLGINSLLPGAAVLLTAFFSLGQYLESRSSAWLGLTVLLFALSLEFKMFFLGPIFGTLLLGSILASLFRKDHALWKVFLGTGLLALPFLAFSYITNLNGPRYTFNFQFVDWIRFSLQGLEFTTLQRTWGDLIHRNIWQLRTVAVVLPVLILFFAGSFGLSGLALTRMARDLFAFRRSSLLRVLVILFFIGCVVFYFSVNVKLDGRDRNVTSIYVFLLGMIVLTLCWSEVLLRFLARRKKALRIMLLILVILLSLPNSLRFLWIKSQSPQAREYSSAFLATTDWIRKRTDHESVFLHPPRMLHSCYFMARRVVLDVSGHSFLTWHLTSDQIQSRAEDALRFFEDPFLNADVLDIYRVAYVLAEKQDFPDDDGFPASVSLYIDMGTKRIRKVKQSHSLTRVFSNQEQVVYRVNPLPEQERQIYVLEEQAGTRIFKRFEPLQ
jgi:MFS family permease